MAAPVTATHTASQMVGRGEDEESVFEVKIAGLKLGHEAISFVVLSANPRAAVDCAKRESPYAFGTTVLFFTRRMATLGFQGPMARENLGFGKFERGGVGFELDVIVDRG